MIDKIETLWPQKRNGNVCPVDGALMENVGQDSLCPQCRRTHEGKLERNQKGEWVLI